MRLDPIAAAYLSEAVKNPDGTVKGTTMLTHSDEVSGLTIFADGTKVYWGEGRSSDVVVVMPSGEKMSFDVSGPYTPQQKKIMDMETEIEENGAETFREMTKAEEREWKKVRHDADSKVAQEIRNCKKCNAVLYGPNSKDQHTKDCPERK